MSRITQMDAEQLKSFIYHRVFSHPKFKSVIAVSVDRYPSEFSATVWVGQEPDLEMRQYAYGLEEDLANLGVQCSIIIKTDRELPFGGTYMLQTHKGAFSYRYYRIDPVKDEDIVYAFAVYSGPQTYRFRLSLTGTLASMLRHRDRFDEEGILGVYRDWIRTRLDEADLVTTVVHEKMFDSGNLSLFAAS
ncbi:MAG: hypothetical protein ACREIY_01825 [Candidatus Rokuibacteriota bacterium]